MAFKELMGQKDTVGIKDISCVFFVKVKKYLYIHFPTGVTKTELKLATYLEIHNTEKQRECLIGPCPQLSSFWYVCSRIWQCCWEPQKILRYLPLIVPSGHMKSSETFVCWSFSSYCQVTRAVFQDARPKLTSLLAQEWFRFLHALARVHIDTYLPYLFKWQESCRMELRLSGRTVALHTLCLSWTLLAMLVLPFCFSLVTAEDYQATGAKPGEFPTAAYSGGLGTADKNFGEECGWDYQHPSSCPQQPPQGPPSAPRPV